jgi:hypothetical protein
MDVHQDLKPPAKGIAHSPDHNRHARAGQFGVGQPEPYHDAEGAVCCLLDGPDGQAIRHHHAAPGVPCSDVHQVDSLI